MKGGKGMSVSELIEHLKTFPQDCQVEIYLSDYDMRLPTDKEDFYLRDLTNTIAIHV